MQRKLSSLSFIVLAPGLGACSGGSSWSNASQGGNSPVSAGCDPADPATHDDWGTVLLGLTDADGDSLNCTVDIVSLTLESANGRVVETLPQSTRISFAEYVDLTETFTAATVPPVTYVAGRITRDNVSAEPFIVGEVAPVDEKAGLWAQAFRVRSTRICPD